MGVFTPMGKSTKANFIITDGENNSMVMVNADELDNESFGPHGKVWWDAVVLHPAATNLAYFITECNEFGMDPNTPIKH